MSSPGDPKGGAEGGEGSRQKNKDQSVAKPVHPWCAGRPESRGSSIKRSQPVSRVHVCFARSGFAAEDIDHAHDADTHVPQHAAEIRPPHRRNSKRMRNGLFGSRPDALIARFSRHHDSAFAAERPSCERSPGMATLNVSSQME